MVSIEELEYTRNRIKTIAKESDSDEEKACADLVTNNLDSLIKQMEAFYSSPAFREYFKQWKDINGVKEND